jgi:hypothetical protein
MKPTQANLFKRLEDLEAQARPAVAPEQLIVRVCFNAPDGKQKTTRWKELSRCVLKTGEEMIVLWPDEEPAQDEARA